MEPDDSDQALADRVAELEQTVADQQEVIRKLLPGRRDLLKAGGGAVVGAGLLSAASGGASAQSVSASNDSEQSGKMGGTGDSNDVYVDQLFDDNGTEFLNVDPGEPVNATQRMWVFDSINDGGPITDGDGTERQVYVIASGAGDPAGAGANDLILEQE